MIIKLRVNMYLLHRIIDSFQRIVKWKKYNIKTSFVTPEGLKARADKTDINLFTIFVFILVDICRKYIIFQYDWKPVLIQQILIGLKAKLEWIIHQIFFVTNYTCHVILHCPMPLTLHWYPLKKGGDNELFITLVTKVL